MFWTVGIEGKRDARDLDKFRAELAVMIADKETTQVKVAMGKVS